MPRNITLGSATGYSSRRHRDAAPAQLARRQAFLDRNQEELAALCRIYQQCALIGGAESYAIVERILRDVIRFLHVSRAFIWLVDDSGAQLEYHRTVGRCKNQPCLAPDMIDQQLVQWVYQQNKSVIVPYSAVPGILTQQNDPCVARTWQSAYFVPFSANEQPIGVLELVDDRHAYHSNDDLLLLQPVAAALARAAYDSRVQGKREAAAILQERHRLATNLHGAINRSLFPASLIADVLPQLWEKDPVEGQHALVNLRTLIRNAAAELRDVLGELRSPIVPDQDFAATIRKLADDFAKRGDHVVITEITGDATPPAHVQNALHTVCEEALVNIIKYAHASQVTIKLSLDAHQIDLIIEDNGRGFVTDHLPPGHFGLGIMQKSMHDVNGQLSISSVPGQGTVVHATYTASPLAKDRALW